MDPIRQGGKPYIVTWYQDGVKKTMRRVPPPKLHDMLPTDVVELKQRRNADFVEGEEYEVKSISSRHPNTLQLQDDDGHTTFVGFTQLELKEARNPDSPLVYTNSPKKNRYLKWP